jgi:hypothetical protein
MQRRDNPDQWFLIDFDDAACPPTTAQPQLRSATHSPAVFEDGHAGEVDMWGVGELIKQCAAEDVHPGLKELGSWMQNPIAPSAEDALVSIKVYQNSKK